MPWPEKDSITRVLAGVVGALLGAFLGFVVLAYSAPHSPTSVVAWGAGLGAALGFGLGYLFGDPAVRFLARLFRLI